MNLVSSINGISQFDHLPYKSIYISIHLNVRIQLESILLLESCLENNILLQLSRNWSEETAYLGASVFYPSQISI